MGQVLVYQAVKFLGLKLFGMKVSSPPKNISIAQDLITLLAVIVNIGLPCYFQGFKVGITCVFIMYTALSLSYWANVAPNHDTIQCVDALEEKETTKNMDWGELQVRSSSDHSTDQNSISNYLTTTFFGGMNYQIEHHLFPCINDIHYPAIAPIVQETCRDFNIPYPHNKTWLEALGSVHQVIKKMQTK
jgi:fatty acid desaturase